MRACYVPQRQINLKQALRLARSIDMTQSPTTMNGAKRNAIVFLVISFAIAIPAAIYFIFFGFEEGNNVSRHGHIALTIGVILAFLSSFLFMGIIFFSARSGADEQPNYVEMAAKERNKNR